MLQLNKDKLRAVDGTFIKKPKTKEILKEIEGIKSYAKKHNLSEKDASERIYNTKKHSKENQIRKFIPQSKVSKGLDVITNPFTAAGYIARNQKIPDRFVSGDRNPFDYAADVINPAFYAKNAYDLTKNIKEGNLKGAAINAVSLLPVVKSVSKSVSKAYKINPLAEKLNNPSSSYRIAGMDAYEDFEKTKVLRSVAKKTEGEGINLTGRPTSFPSFQKGYADSNYMPKEGGVVFKTDLPTYKIGEINPVTGKKITGRHYAHRVIDESGEAMQSIPAKNIKVYKGKPHWLMGHQEIKGSGKEGESFLKNIKNKK